jgi:chemotaxis protein MotB
MPRRKRPEEHQNHEAWAIPYGDLVTLLLAFFVVMYAISSVNEGKYRVLSDSLVAAFRGAPMTVAPVQAAERPDGPVVPFIGIAEDPARARQLEEVAASIEAAMQELIERGMIAVRRKDDTVEVEIRTDILFPSGQSQLTPRAVQVIERIGDTLMRFPNPLNVEGHTDDRPIATPQFPSNWELSAARAASVVHLLTQRGLQPSRLTVVGYGEQQPIRSNATADGRNANRRVLLLIRGLPAAGSMQVAAAR